MKLLFKTVSSVSPRVVEVKDVQIALLLTCLLKWGKTTFKHTVTFVLVNEDHPKISKKESGDMVQEEETSKPNSKKCDLTSYSKKLTKGNSVVSTKKRKVIEMSEKKRKKKKI
jgi:protein MAK11